MAKKDTLFTVAGITTHSRADVSVTKVRYGTDMARMVKMLNSNRKIGVTRPVGGREDGFLDPVRVDIVELPSGMVKADALKFLAQHSDFQSAEDQALIAEESGKREPKAPRVKKARAEKTVKVRASKKSAPSLDSIKARGRKSTAAVTESQAETVSAESNGVVESV